MARAEYTQFCVLSKKKSATIENVVQFFSHTNYSLPSHYYQQQDRGKGKEEEKTAASVATSTITTSLLGQNAQYWMVRVALYLHFLLIVHISECHTNRISIDRDPKQIRQGMR